MSSQLSKRWSWAYSKHFRCLWRYQWNHLNFRSNLIAITQLLLLTFCTHFAEFLHRMWISARKAVWWAKNCNRLTDSTYVWCLTKCYATVNSPWQFHYGRIILEKARYSLVAGCCLFSCDVSLSRICCIFIDLSPLRTLNFAPHYLLRTSDSLPITGFRNKHSDVIYTKFKRIFRHFWENLIPKLNKGKILVARQCLVKQNFLLNIFPPYQVTIFFIFE